MLHYPVRLTTEGERVLVDFPDFPEAHTFGDTREEALTRASGRPVDRDRCVHEGPATPATALQRKGSGRCSTIGRAKDRAVQRNAPAENYKG